jgi:antirestriction protein ArdC
MSTETTIANITDRLVETIESGNHGTWTKPWTTTIAGSGLGINALTGKGYQGMNQLVLMVTTAAADYSANVWATYKQWQTLGGQVRKGETGTQLVKWGITYFCQDCDHKGRTECKRQGHRPATNLWASPFTVFNVDQQDGYVLEVPEVEISEIERMDQVDAFIAATGATIHHRLGDRAYFDRQADHIVLPALEQFETCAGYYGTVLHELTHWAGHSTRLDRIKGRVFGDEAYAGEELVAELGATFLAARFGVEVEPHEEHAAYLASWLRSLKADPRALYRAAKDAQVATEYLLAAAGEEAAPEAEVA